MGRLLSEVPVSPPLQWGKPRKQKRPTSTGLTTKMEPTKTPTTLAKEETVTKENPTKAKTVGSVATSGH
jgi:hypothetical protein